MSNSEDPDAKIRGLYRIGHMDQELQEFESSLEYFNKVKALDESFCSDIVNLRIAEVNYKLGNLPEAFEALSVSEKTIQMKDKYMLHLLRGKCYDKQRKFEQAIDEYQSAVN
jgi:tetratricopeptide (TPR) repeat protein